MRRLIDIIAMVLLIAIAAWFANDRVESSKRNAIIERTNADVQRLRQVIAFHAAAGDVALTKTGWPITVDPAWFEGSVPLNHLVSSAQPWLEIADELDASLEHPPSIVAEEKSEATFWYNANNGIVRARVPRKLSDRSAIELYNRVNQCRIDSVLSFSDESTSNETPRPRKKPAFVRVYQKND